MNKAMKMAPALAALALLAVVVIAIAEPLRNLGGQSQSPASDTATTSASGYPVQDEYTSTAAQGYPDPGTEAIEPIHIPIHPTPPLLPDQGVRIGELQETPLQKTDTSIEQIHAVDLVGNSLIGAAQLSDGLAVVSVDVSSGEARLLSQVVPGLNSIVASEQYIAWLRSGAVEDAEIFQAYQIEDDNLILEREFAVGQRALRFLDLNESIAVWEEFRDDMFTIVAYDLASGQELATIGGPGIRVVPRACGGSWIEYVWLENPRAATAEIHAYNIATGETLVLSRMPILNSSEPPDRYHDCDDSRVAWISWAEDSGYAQHIYTLDDRADRILDVPIPRLVVSQVLLSGEVLIGPVAGYDLVNDVAFSLTLDIPLPNYTSSRLMLSGDRLAVLVNELNGSQRLYTALIVRD